jgi:hypothetical protein
MTDERIVYQLRRLLLGLVVATFVGTIIELWLSDHTGEPKQLIPFALCALGLITALAVLIRPQRATILALRAVMIVTAAGSLLGMYFHLKGNFDFELDIRPNATAGEVIVDALKGADPLLAPGILALVAVLAIAATYYHPALRQSSDNVTITS